MERGLPDKRTVGLELHAEEWVGEGCEIVVVDPGIDVSSFWGEGGEGPDVGFN